MEATAAGAPKHPMLLTVLFVGVLMGALDIAIVGPAMPAIQAQFGVDDRAMSGIFSIYVLFNLIGTPLMAKLSDRFGRRSVYTLAVLLFALGSLLVAVSPSFGMLLGGRALQAFGAGGVFPVASAVVGDVYPPEKRGGPLGMIGAVFGLAFLVGPPLGAGLLRFGWHWLFLINLPIALAVMAMGWKVLPIKRSSDLKPFDRVGMALLTVMLSALVYGVTHLNTSDWAMSLRSLQVLPFLLVAAALIPLFWKAERRAIDPILTPALFQSRQVVLAVSFAAIAGLGEAGMVFLPKLAASELGMPLTQASFMMMPVVLAMAVGAPVGGRLLDRIGSKAVVLPGLAILAAGMGVFGLAGPSRYSFIAAGALVGLGLAALLGAPLRYILLNETGEDNKASAQALLTTFTSVGQLLSGA
ncbi:MAG TPA: MFS transporter, partial [Stenomitos sp.]